MKKTKIIVVTVLCAALLIVGAVAFAGEELSEAYQAGQIFRDANDTGGAGLLDNSGGIVAEYNGHKITAGMVDYYKKMNLIRNEEDAQNYQTDRQVIEKIVESIVLLEEAERRGFGATEQEIEDLANATREAYALPEGKEYLDEYCAGAGITVEEYFAYVRDQAPRMLARQKLKNAIGQEYCAEHGLEYTKVNPPAEMTEAVENFIEELLEQHKDEIIYHTGDTV